MKESSVWVSHQNNSHKSGLPLLFTGEIQIFVLINIEVYRNWKLNDRATNYRRFVYVNKCRQFI